ncbi:MAG: hypothetical protein IPK82_23690 [Polyangiaceae bacterium]|nr:hypothetical protein [Polyangiaceae bacterium]
MKEIFMSGLAKAIVDLILFPLICAGLWVVLVHFRAAEIVGWPAPTLPKIALIAFVGVLIR